MSNSNADRNLLFGVLALQNAFISREELIAAFSVWLQDKQQRLDEILLERQALSADEHSLLVALAKQHLKRHDDDPEKSLAAVSSIWTSMRAELQQLGDADVEASLTRLTTQKPEHDSYATEHHSVGESTSQGTRFRILRPHEKGGLGQVSVALDSELGREVALKEVWVLEQHADAAQRAGKAEIARARLQQAIDDLQPLSADPTDPNAVKTRQLQRKLDNLQSPEDKPVAVPSVPKPS